MDGWMDALALASTRGGGETEPPWEMVRDTPRKYPSSDDPIHDDAGSERPWSRASYSLLGEEPSRRCQTLLPRNQGNEKGPV